MKRPKNRWLCFRKTFDCLNLNEIEDVILNVTADSRYYLFINGIRVGMGPARSWPAFLSYDEYRIGHYLRKGKNVIAVLVNHYGVSTSQYLIGRGGLIAQANIINDNRVVSTIYTDKTWKCRVHPAFTPDTSRINFAQPWVEVYDAREMHEEWIHVEYDDSGWGECVELGPFGMDPWSTLEPRDIPMLTWEDVYPRNIKSIKSVMPVGQNITINFRNAVYPDDYSTDDRVLLGYICTFIKACRPMKGTIKLMTREWIQNSLKVKLNQRELELLPFSNNQPVELDAGPNLLLLDISGAWQQYYIDLHFEFPEELEFTFPWEGKEYMFAAIGPIESKKIGNISCMDRAEIDWDNPVYKNIFHICNFADIEKFKNYVRGIDNSDIIINGIKLVCTEKEELKTHTVLPSSCNMLVANNTPTVISFEDNADLEYIIDFGQEVTGFIEFDLEARNGTIFDMLFFEFMAGGKPEIPHDLDNTMRYIAREGRQRYTSFHRRGFRYVMLTVRNTGGHVKIFSLKVKQSTYPVADMGSFKCSDFLLNSIWDISKRTLMLCMEDTYVDCPGFEQACWIGDARVEALCGYYAFGAKDIVKRGLKLAAQSLERSDIPESHVPAGHSLIIPLWGILWIISCKEYYIYTGDREFIVQIYPYIRKAAYSYLSYINDKGLFEIEAWNMFDWAKMDTPSKGIVSHQNAGLVKALEDAAFLSNVVGNKEDKIYFFKMIEEIKHAINIYLWDDTNQAYTDSLHEDGSMSKTISIQTNTLMYLWSCAGRERREKLAAYFNKMPKDFIKISSPFASFFYFEALAECKKIKNILADIRKNWGEMLRFNSTTCWETFKGFYKDRLSRSYCHGWSSAPVYFLGAYLLGVRPLKEGFRSVVINPDPCDIKWAEGTVPTPLGPIEVKWFIEEGIFNLDLRIPEKIEFKVIIPEKYKKHNKTTINENKQGAQLWHK